MEQDIITYYPSGKIETTVPSKNGVRHGLFKNFYETGELMYEGSFENGKQEGVFKLYYKNGDLKRENNFKNDIKIFQKEYYEGNKIKSETSYNEDTGNESSKKEWDEEGNLTEKEEISINNSGKLLMVRSSYYENGKIEEKSNLIQTDWGWNKHGLYQSYYESGQLKEEGIIENDTYQGEWKEYFESGKIEKITNYIQGFGGWERKEFYESGELKMTHGFKNQKPTIGIHYFKNGTKKMESTFDGSHQPIKEWDEKGNLIFDKTEEFRLKEQRLIRGDCQPIDEWWDNNHMKVSKNIKLIIEEEIGDFREEFLRGEYKEFGDDWGQVSSRIVSQNLGSLGHRINEYIDSVWCSQWDEEDETYIKFEEEFYHQFSFDEEYLDEDK